MNKTQTKNLILLFLTATIWGFAFVAQSVSMEYIRPFTFNSIRNLIGASFLLPCIWLLNRGKSKDVSEKPAAVIKSERKNLLIGGLCCGVALFLASSFQQFGMQYTSVGKAGFITTFYIVLVPIFGMFLKKKNGPFIWLAVLFALVGLYLLCMTDQLTLNRGDALILACAFLFTIHILVIDYFTEFVDGVKMAFLQFLVCGVLSGIPMLLLEKPQISQIMAAGIPILYAGILSCGVAYTLQIVGQKGTNPTVASLIMSLESCIAVLAGWLILRQTLSTREIAGCIIMFGAIILAQIPKRRLAYD